MSGFEGRITGLQSLMRGPRPGASRLRNSKLHAPNPFLLCLHQAIFPSPNSLPNMFDDHLKFLFLNGPALSVDSEPSQGETNFGDSSGPLFTMYSRIGEEEDNRMAELAKACGRHFREMLLSLLVSLTKPKVKSRRVFSLHSLHPSKTEIELARYLSREHYVLHANPNQCPSVAKLPALSPATSAVW
jgi:hypothetical protein